MTKLVMPNDWQPTSHQMPVWTALAEGIRRISLAWHRRAGKDSLSFNHLCTQAATVPGVYWHLLPTGTQARKVLWNGVDRHGRNVLRQALPPPLWSGVNKQEMFVELKNGSIVQLAGSDNYDNLVGANPRGVVFSEYAISNPSAWTYIRPMLLENNGWAIFNSTPRGHNHFYDLHHRAEVDPLWYASLLNIEQTCREDGSRIFTDEQYQQELNEGMEESKALQEYYCSWEGGLEGAYFTNEVADIRENRYMHIPLAPDAFVLTAWDIGLHDKTAIGWFMKHPTTGHPVLIDAYEDRNKGLDYYIRHVKNKTNQHHWHFGPHDLKKHEYTNNTRIVDTAADMGINFEVLEKSSKYELIENLRAFLKVLWVVPNARTDHVLNMLASYQKEYDEKRQIFKDTPNHNYASDSADMMQYAAQAWEPGLLDGRYATAHTLDTHAKRAMG